MFLLNDSTWTHPHAPPTNTICCVCHPLTWPTARRPASKLLYCTWATTVAFFTYLFLVSCVRLNSMARNSLFTVSNPIPSSLRCEICVLRTPPRSYGRAASLEPGIHTNAHKFSPPIPRRLSSSSSSPNSLLMRLAESPNIDRRFSLLYSLTPNPYTRNPGLRQLWWRSWLRANLRLFLVISTGISRYEGEEAGWIDDRFFFLLLLVFVFCYYHYSRWWTSCSCVPQNMMHRLTPVHASRGLFFFRWVERVFFFYTS